jgi:hypothetical protein
VDITGYRFGALNIGQQVYKSDVIITPDRILDAWWRRRRHRVSVADLADVMAARPDVVVVGTGYFGRMSLSEDVRRYLLDEGVVVLERRTAQAVEDFNNLQHTKRGRIVAALHLTC